MIAWDPVYSLSEPDFLIFFSESYHVTSNVAECRYYTNFKGPHICIVRGYSHMVGYAGSAIRIAHASMTLTWSKVKVKVIELLKFRNLHFSTPFWCGAQNWWLITTVWDLAYSFSEPDFWISPQLAVTWLQSSWNVDMTRIHWVFFVLPEARSLWLQFQVGCNKPCTVAAITVSPIPGLFLCGWLVGV